MPLRSGTGLTTPEVGSKFWVQGEKVDFLGMTRSGWVGALVPNFF